ncbi:MAG: biotin--[acetyl-CoA-carboxylase] ligase [Candidatus Nanopelagicales bacterium]|nr:biotin--[acetyl-CoA-carboxylase] ligase [Candidatus Nanopelagicales bacterium]
MAQISGSGPQGDETGSGFDLAEVMAGLRQLKPDWPPVTHVAETSSTNSDATHAAMAGAAAWSIYVADHQTAGRGRVGRSWQAPARSSLLASIVLRPPATVPHDLFGWVPLLMGMAITRALRSPEVPAGLKWPNDVVINSGEVDGLRKIAGVLSESHLNGSPVLVVGFGVNVSMTADQLPVETATSLSLLGKSQPDRGRLLVSIMAELLPLWDAWVRARGDAARVGIREEYEALSVVVGRQVRVSLPTGEELRGTGLGVDEFGHLRVATHGSERIVSAGDVVHVRF